MKTSIYGENWNRFYFYLENLIQDLGVVFEGEGFYHQGKDSMLIIRAGATVESGWMVYVWNDRDAIESIQFKIKELTNLLSKSQH